MRVLSRQWDAIIANPPYISAPKEVVNAYRARYVSAHGKYGLGAPFTERMFELARDGGFIAQITSNAFMKREYGVSLVEQVLPYYDLTQVIDTAGVHLFGHGTPTMILVARNRAPTGAMVPAVMGTRGEPGKPTGATPWGASVATKLLRAVDALAAELAVRTESFHENAADLAAARIAAAGWITTCAALRAFDQRRAFCTGRAAPDDEHLARSFERVAVELPDGEWFDPQPWNGASAPLNPCWSRMISDAQSDRIRAQVRAAFEEVPEPASQAGLTDWIGDIYQSLDGPTAKTHALAQTPWFVTEFLCARAVDPALAEFGAVATVLDPACGTGHLLVGAFVRLFQRRADPEDDGPEYTFSTCARMALDQLGGCDLNPVAAGIARWRLMLAYVDAEPPRSFSCVPDDLPIHVDVGDALLEGRAARRIDHAKRWPATEASCAAPTPSPGHDTPTPTTVPAEPPAAPSKARARSGQLTLF